MTARSPGSIFASLLLHGAVILAILLLSGAWSRREPAPEPVFELVTGPLQGDETNPEAPELDIPDSPPLPEFTPPALEPEPEPPAPEAQKLPPNQPKPMSIDEFRRRHPQKPPSKATPPAPRPIAAPKVNTRDITRSGAGAATGNSLNAARQNELDAYFSRLRTALKQNHEKPPGLPDLLSADIEFLIAADGSISRVRVARGSGDAEFDRSCLEAFKRLGTIGPRPDGKSDVRMVTFRMKEE